MKRALPHEGAPPLKDKGAHIADENAHEYATAAPPPDVRNCTVAINVWGQDPTVFIDALVVGFALERQGSRARRVCCLDAGTEDSYFVRLLAEFWDIMRVRHLDLPVRVTRHGMVRLPGVFSKLQAWKLFASGEFRADNVVLMNVGMLPKYDFDRLFCTKTPGGIFRGATGNRPMAARPKGSCQNG